jgi:hypothetical protein
MVKSLILASILLLTVLIEHADACMGPHIRIFPACDISTPRDDERVTIVYANSGTGLSSVTLGSDAIVTEVVDIEIGVADKPHYIVLSSGKPIIWRFKGRIDAISRVVVLGSQYNGAARTGIVGVPRERVVFTEPHMQTVQWNSCISQYSACEASAYFNIPKADRMRMAGDEPSERYRVDQFVEHLRAGVVRIPRDGWVEAEARGRWQTVDGWTSMTGPALGRYEPYGGTDYIETSQSHERGLIKIDATSVVSQEVVRDYAILPATVGIQQLLAAGKLVGPENAQFKAAYDKWNDRISRPYRSKLDPDFLFSYKVNYLGTGPMTLPAGLDRVSLLVAEGIEAPDINGNNYTACLYFADLRDIQLDRRKSTDSRCDASSGNLVLSTSESSLAMMARSLERQVSQADKDKCRSLSVASDAYFAGIAVSEGPAWRPAATDTPRRRIDVIVNRPGKVALYLEMDGGLTDWQILPSAQTQITNVVLGELASRGPLSAVRGLDPSVPVQTINSEPLDRACHQFYFSRYAHLGGPAVLALDQGLQVLVGRGLDSLLRKTNDGSWPPIVGDQDAPRVTLAIE